MREDGRPRAAFTFQRLRPAPPCPPCPSLPLTAPHCACRPAASPLSTQPLVQWASECRAPVCCTCKLPAAAPSSCCAVLLEAFPAHRHNPPRSIQTTSPKERASEQLPPAPLHLRRHFTAQSPNLRAPKQATTPYSTGPTTQSPLQTGRLSPTPSIPPPQPLPGGAVPPPPRPGPGAAGGGDQRHGRHPAAGRRRLRATPLPAHVPTPHSSAAGEHCPAGLDRRRALSCKPLLA